MRLSCCSALLLFFVATAPDASAQMFHFSCSNNPSGHCGVTEVAPPRSYSPHRSSDAPVKKFESAWRPMTAKEQRKFQEAVAAQFAREKQQALARYENALSAMSPVRGASHPVVSSRGFRPGGTAFFGGSSGAGSVADEITWEAEELTPPSNIKLDASTAYPALYLLTYAAGLQGDDKAFLVQQAGFAMQRGEFALNVPEVGAAKVVAEVPQFIAREEKVLAQQQRFAKLRSEWVGAANKEEDLELLESTLIHDVVEKNVAEAKEVLTKQEPTAATPPADEPTDDLLKRAEALLARTQSNLATVTTEKQQLEAEKKQAAKDVQNAVEERNALLSQ